jgi:eukaryotic-like serine/threonine-protein kinase
VGRPRARARPRRPRRGLLARPRDGDERSPEAAASPDANTAADTPSAEGATASVDGRLAPELCHDPPLAGRDEALAVLDRAAREARAGGARMVLVTGPLGIGRSRLLAAAITAAAIPEARVLRARCSPERRGPLRPPLRAFEALPPGAAGPLGQIQDAAERAASPRALGGARDTDDALEGVEDALLWASADEPLLLVVDDLQWGDAHTLELLRLLAERAALSAEARLFVVAAARDEPHPGAPLRALLGQVCAGARPGVKHLPLGPLAPAESARLAQGIGPLGPEVLEAVVRGAGGVPFFAVHALLAWRETGALVWRGGAFHAAASLAEVPGVAALLEARLGAWFEAGSALERAALRALAASALHGGGLAVELLFEVCGDEASLERALEVLAGAGILTVTGDRQEYGFAAEMVRQAALNLVRQRPWFSRLYRALLDTIARGEGPSLDAAFLATGYERLGALDPARLWLRRAMDGAALAGLFADAAELGDRLAAITPDLDARAGVALDVVRALVKGRQFEDAGKRLARLVETTGDPGAPPSRGELRRRIYRLEVMRGLNEAGGDEALLADADRLGDPALACEARMALAGVAPEDRALLLAGEAVALAERLGAPTELAARVLRVELCYAAGRRDLDLARGDLVRSLALAEAAGSPFLALHIEGDLAPIEADLGHLDDAVARLRRLLGRAEALGMQGQRRLLSQNLAVCLLRAGLCAEAAETALQTAELSASAGDPVLRSMALSLRADALRRAGDLEGALGSSGEAERLQAEHGDRYRALTLFRRAEILDALGRAEEARDEAREAQIVADRHGDRIVAVTAALWGALHRARRGEASPADVRTALAEAIAAGAGTRELARGLVVQVEEWLAASALDQRGTGGGGGGAG